MLEVRLSTNTATLKEHDMLDRLFPRLRPPMPMPAGAPIQKRRAKNGFSPVLAVFKGGSQKQAPEPPAQPESTEFDVDPNSPLTKAQARKRGRRSSMKIALSKGAGPNTHGTTNESK